MGGSAPQVSVVVPVYRASKVLYKLSAEVAHTFEALGYSYELVLVEDCGGDNSWDIIRELASTNPAVRGIRLQRNFGQHNALLCGIRTARAPVVVTIDDDLQNPPSEIPRLLAKLDEGFDVVYGSPERETHGFLRDGASKLTKLVLQGAMGATTASRVSAFRAFRANLRQAFTEYSSPMVNIDVLLTWGTTSFSFVTVRQDARKEGLSGYTLGKLVNHAFNMITGFSIVPLHLASLLGFFFSFLGLLSLAYVLVRYLITDVAVPGFAFIASMVAIFSGVQLFAIGIIGEYVGRVHLRTMNRPAYLVDATAEQDDRRLPERL